MLVPFAHLWSQTPPPTPTLRIIQLLHETSSKLSLSAVFLFWSFISILFMDAYRLRINPKRNRFYCLFTCWIISEMGMFLNTDQFLKQMRSKRSLRLNCAKSLPLCCRRSGLEPILLSWTKDLNVFHILQYLTIEFQHQHPMYSFWRYKSQREINENFVLKIVHVIPKQNNY